MTETAVYQKPFYHFTCDIKYLTEMGLFACERTLSGLAQITILPWYTKTKNKLSDIIYQGIWVPCTTDT